MADVCFLQHAPGTPWPARPATHKMRSERTVGTESCAPDASWEGRAGGAWRHDDHLVTTCHLERPWHWPNMTVKHDQTSMNKLSWAKWVSQLPGHWGCSLEILNGFWIHSTKAGWLHWQVWNRLYSGWFLYMFGPMLGDSLHLPSFQSAKGVFLRRMEAYWQITTWMISGSSQLVRIVPVYLHSCWYDTGFITWEETWCTPSGKWWNHYWYFGITPKVSHFAWTDLLHQLTLSEPSNYEYFCKFPVATMWFYHVLSEADLSVFIYLYCLSLRIRHRPNQAVEHLVHQFAHENSNKSAPKIGAPPVCPPKSLPSRSLCRAMPIHPPNVAPVAGSVC